MFETLLAALYSRQTIVTANNRLSRTLLHQYNCRQRLAGLTAWESPVIYAWSHWLQHLWSESRLRKGVAYRCILLDDAATDLLWQQCIAAMEPDRPALSLRTFAKSARAAWKLVNDWDALAAPEWTLAGLGPDQQAWLRWSGHFRQRCSEANWIDPERLANQLTEDVRKGLFDDLGSIQFAGFDAWPPGWRVLRNALHERGIEIIDIAGPTHAARSIGRPCADADSELLAAAWWARSLIESDSDSIIGVVVPDLSSRAADVRRVFLDIFAADWRINGVPAGLPLNVSFGQSLAQVPVIHAALLLLRLAGQRQVGFRDFSALLRSGWLIAAETERWQRGRLEIELRRSLRYEFGLDDALVLCRKYVPAFAKTVTALLDSAPHAGNRSMLEWGTIFSAQLRAAGWPGDAPVDSEIWQALKSWNELLGAFARSGKIYSEGVDRAAALAWLEELASQHLFQTEGVADGVQVMGVLEATGLEFDHLWVCGMARELWPAVAHPSVFVPLDLQRRLAMPNSTAALTLDYAARVTQRLLCSAPDVILSWPVQQDGEGLNPSPLIGQVSESRYIALPDANEPPLWNEVAATDRQAVLLEDDPPPALPLGNKVRGGASVLNLQAISPLNAFIEKRLGAAEIESPAVGISARERGNLIHRVLELFYTAYPDRAAAAQLSPENRQGALEAFFREAVATLPGIDAAFMQRIIEFEIAQQVPRLTAFIDLDLQRSDFKVIACEKKYLATIASLQLHLKLDRLDELADGRKFIIDYKTGLISRQAWNPAKPRDMQLPLYATTIVPDAAAVAFAQISVQGIQYDGVGVADFGIAGIRSPGSRPRIEVKFQHPHNDAAINSWQELRDAWAGLLLSLAEQFAAGDYRLDPRNPASARGQFAVLSRIYDSDSGIYEEEP